MSDSKVQMHSTETDTKPKGGACKRHCQKFWWLHLIIFVVISVVVVVVSIFAVVPKIAQDKINAADLKVQHVQVLSPTPESFRMIINSTITTDGAVHADIDPFVGQMFLEDVQPHTPFAELNFPATNAEKFQNVDVDQIVKIVDLDAFTKFNTWFINNKTVKVSISGKTNVQPRGLNKKYGVDFYKTIDFKGLNTFNGTTVTNGKVNATAFNTTNFWANVDLPNQSDYTIDLGNATFANYIGDTLIGYLYINNLVLAPGSNKLPVTGQLDQIKVLKFFTQKPSCEQGGIIPFILRGVNVTNAGQNLTYFGTALAQTTQILKLNVTEILANSGTPIQPICT